MNKWNKLCVDFFIRNKKEDKREKSLSPLSKRMALMEPSPVADGLTGLLAQRLSHYNPPAMPHSFASKCYSLFNF